MIELAEQNKMTNVSILIEAGMESTFQFLLQSLYVLPTILLALAKFSSFYDLVDIKILSILMSFVTFSWSSFSIRLEIKIVYWVKVKGNEKSLKSSALQRYFSNPHRNQCCFYTSLRAYIYKLCIHTLLIFRNRDKSQALGFKNLIIFILKVICDVTSRISILGAWLYTTNDGTFSSVRVTIYFYTMATINFLENLAFSIHNREDIVSFRNITGK